MIQQYWYTGVAYSVAKWWGISLGRGCVFHGMPFFRRHPGSTIRIGSECRFLSLPSSNLIGINKPCMLSTLAEEAEIAIGESCGFSGTVIGCAERIVLGDNVRCGANTVITDTDWHGDDKRAGRNGPVVIGNDVWLGINVTVLKGVTIGDNTLVGAGSIVNRSLPPNVVAAGNPAKIIRMG
ncbi:MAG: acyltransferase [Thermodesulfobacteriota bacterium]